MISSHTKLLEVMTETQKPHFYIYFNGNEHASFFKTKSLDCGLGEEWIRFKKNPYVNFILQISSNYLRAMYSVKMKFKVVYIAKDIAIHNCW